IPLQVDRVDRHGGPDDDEISLRAPNASLTPVRPAPNPRSATVCSRFGAEHSTHWKFSHDPFRQSRLSPYRPPSGTEEVPRAVLEGGYRRSRPARYRQGASRPSLAAPARRRDRRDP